MIQSSGRLSGAAGGGVPATAARARAAARADDNVRTLPALSPLPLMIGPLGMQEMLIILVVALIVFGPRKLPQIGKTLGKSIAEFRRTSTELRSTLEREVQMEEFRAARSEVSDLKKDVTDLGRGLDPDRGSGPPDAKPQARRARRRGGLSSRASPRRCGSGRAGGRGRGSRSRRDRRRGTRRRERSGGRRRGHGSGVSRGLRQVTGRRRPSPPHGTP